MAIKDWPGGVVTDIPVEPSGNYEDSAASGVWTLDQVSDYVKQDLWPTPGNIDPAKYVEGVFSTYLYTGNGSTQTITNGIDLAGEGGLVWTKRRSTSGDHVLIDSVRGGSNALFSSNTSANYNNSQMITSFNANGYALGSYGGTNDNGETLVGWSFRKAEKFFDVVTWTGDGVTGRTVSHNLGSAPGIILAKRTDSTANWAVYSSTLGGGYYAALDGTDPFYLNSNRWNGVDATDTEFTLGSSTAVNGSGGTFVAYLFASDAGGFGDDGDENIIKCGSYTGNGSSNGPDVNLGFEPQFLMVKNTTGGNWVIADTMRSFGVEDMASLYPNASNAESTIIAGKGITPTATGFKCIDGNATTNQNAASHIYIAIRRPMKTPESGTEVGAVDDRAFATPAFVSDFPVDLYWRRSTIAGNFRDYARLRGDNYLQHDGTNAETSEGAFFDSNTGVVEGGSASTTDLAWMFKRATGFFDVVAYTGNTTTQAVTHNLGVTPELIIVKARQSNIVWAVWSKSLEQYELIQLNTSNAKNGDVGDYGYWTATVPTSTQFSVGTYDTANKANEGMIAYLFATLAGVSKVGSYTGQGSNVDVDCGFSAGARFILIKRTDSTGDWYVYDYFRGIVSGNDPYLLLNTGTGQVTNTDYIDPLNAGFTVTSSAPAALNASGGSYIFLAIA